MSMEKEWITESGLNAAVAKANHRCGYVGVPASHPLFGKDYSDTVNAKVSELGDFPIGKRGIIDVFLVAVDPERQLSLGFLFNVHGGITFSGNQLRLNSNLWWFGYDCMHAGDTLETCTLEFCIGECESLAKQLAAFPTDKRIFKAEGSGK